MVVSIAPAVRVAISEPFGLAPGAITVGQLVAGLRKLGFDQVFGESQAPASTMHACMRLSPHPPLFCFHPFSPAAPVLSVVQTPFLPRTSPSWRRAPSCCTAWPSTSRGTPTRTSPCPCSRHAARAGSVSSLDSDCTELCLCCAKKTFPECGRLPCSLVFLFLPMPSVSRILTMFPT